MKKRTTYKMVYRGLIVKTIEAGIVFGTFFGVIALCEMLCKLLGVG